VFGLALSGASTVVMLKALEQHGLLDSVNGCIAIGWLVVEDVATVVVLVVLPVIAASTSSGPWSAARGQSADPVAGAHSQHGNADGREGAHHAHGALRHGCLQSRALRASGASATSALDSRGPIVPFVKTHSKTTLHRG
jgi:hypothetical protein